jgi:hypothetical protein
LVVEIAPFVHPDFRHAGGVLVDNLGHAPRESVRGFVSKHVAYMRAGGYFQNAAALPNLVSFWPKMLTKIPKFNCRIEK